MKLHAQYLLLSALMAFPFPSLSAKSPETNPWRLCALYPHLKDPYWLSINFGMTEQARKRQVTLIVHEAGGYQKSTDQWQQVETCLQWQADAILLGSVSFEQFSVKLEQLNHRIPIFGLVNELSTIQLSGSTGVSWYQMGYNLGNYLARRHPPGSPAVKLAWFPGPRNGGGSPQATAGLKAAIADSAVGLTTIQYGLNEKISQFALLDSTLSRFTDLDYLAGNAIMAEMAVSELPGRPLEHQPQILSHYLTHGIYRGIKRGKILMANTDQMVLQGKMAIDQAVDFLEGKPFKQSQGPAILTIKQDTLEQISIPDSLSPNNFKPRFQIPIEKHPQ